MTAPILAAQNLCMAYYFLGRYGEAIEAGDRALARSPGRNIQTMTHPFLAAAYAEMGRDQDAEGERAIVARLSPFFDAERFAGQFGTQEARDHLLDGLKRPGFVEAAAVALFANYSSSTKISGNTTIN